MNTGHTSDEELNSTSFQDFQLKILALQRQICGVSVENMDVLRFDVDVFEEVLPHKRMVALRVISSQCCGETVVVIII